MDDTTDIDMTATVIDTTDIDMTATMIDTTDIDTTSAIGNTRRPPRACDNERKRP